MDRAALEALVIARLEKHAAYDPLAWLPVIGSTRQDGARHGLSVELLGARPRPSELESLQRGLFQLAREGRIEVAQFAAGAENGGPMPRHPRRSDETTYLALSVRPDAGGATFAVRMASVDPAGFEPARDRL